MHQKASIIISFFLLFVSINVFSVDLKKADKTDKVEILETQDPSYKKVSGTFLLKKIKKEATDHLLEFSLVKKAPGVQTIFIRSKNVHESIQEKQEYNLEADVQVSQTNHDVAQALQIMIIIHRAKERIPIWIVASDRKVLDLRHSKISFLNMHHEDFRIL